MGWAVTEQLNRNILCGVVREAIEGDGDAVQGVGVGQQGCTRTVRAWLLNLVIYSVASCFPLSYTALQSHEGGG